MSEKIDISIVIAFYNRRDLVDKCLDAVLAQTLPAPKTFEVIAVDNGSTDGTREALAARGDITLIDCPRPGPAAARNAGIERARGDIVVFTDSDAIPQPGWLAALTAPFDDPTVTGTGGPIEALSMERGVEMWFQLSGLLDQRVFFKGNLCFPPYFATANAAWRADALRRVNGFDENIWWAEDCDLGWRIRRGGEKIVYVNDAVIKHTHRSTIRGFMRQGMGYGEAAAHVFSLHRDIMGTNVFIDWRSYGRFLILPLVCLGALIFGANSYQRRAPFYEWLWRAANLYGCLRGCLRYRVIFIA